MAWLLFCLNKIKAYIVLLIYTKTTGSPRLLMKKNILILLILSAINTTFAQEVTKIPLAQEVHTQWYTFKNGDDTILVQNYREKRNKWYLITILDSKEQIKKSHKISETDDILINISFSDNIISFLFQKNNFDESKIHYYVNMVNLSDFNESKKTLFTAVENNSETIRRFLRVKPGSIFGEVNVTDDSGFTSIIYSIRTDESKTRTAYMFDKNYNEVFKQTKTYSGANKEERFEYVSSFIDKSKQNIVVINRRRDLNKYMLEHITKDEYLFKDFSFKKDGGYNISVVNSVNGFQIVGFFSAEDKNNEDALLYASFSEDLELLDEKYTSLSKDFFDALNKKQKKRGMLLDLHSVLIDNFDNVYIIGEAKRVGVKGRDTQGFNNLYGIPDDVIVCKTDKTGTLIWSKLVNKSQKFYHTHFASFRPFLINNNLHYVFNSEMKLEQVITDRKSGKSMQPGSGQRFSVYLVSFDKDGAFKHFKLTDKKVDLRYMTTNSGLIENEAILLFGTRKKKHGVLKIKI